MIGIGDQVEFKWAGHPAQGWVVGASTEGKWAVLFNSIMSAMVIKLEPEHLKVIVTAQRQSETKETER